jgi:L-threonylcarbamoyladenylate synthase
MLRDEITRAAEIIREGGLVAFPTETVYGLGADAFNADAVARIYSEKGRPSDNPLILHIANISDFEKLAHNPPDYAFALIKKFWAGPLTFVAKKNPSLPDRLGCHPQRATETIAVRFPAHLVAQALIKESRCIIAAPSANKSGRPSPTTLAHVREDFPTIEALDGGNATVGLESTVVDITGERPIILRPGFITEEDIFGALPLNPHFFFEKNRQKTLTGNRDSHKSFEGARGDFFKSSPEKSRENNPRSPGTKYKHYAPRAEMTLVSGEPAKIAEYILNRKEKKIGVLVREKTCEFFRNRPSNIEFSLLGEDEKEIAQNLFSRLRECDQLGVEIIFAEAVSEKGLGVAIMDRMRKAAEGRIVNV